LLIGRTGSEIDWALSSVSQAGRDLLYIARDLSVNGIALPHLQNPRTVIRTIGTRDRLQGHRALPGLLHDVIRPSRAIAFEKLPEADALAQHSKLAPVYWTLHAVPAYFASKLLGDRKGQQAAVVHPKLDWTLAKSSNVNPPSKPSTDPQTTPDQPRASGTQAIHA
jgi:cell filamentation protein